MLVRRGVDPGDLVHAYLVAQNEFWRAWMEELAQRVPAGPDLTTALERSSERVFTRADYLVAELMRHVDRERVRWMGGALARRTEVVRDLLAGEQTDAAEASRALGYDLDRWVLAACSGRRAESGSDEGLEAQAARARPAAAGIARAHPRARRATLWAWIGTPGPPDLTASPRRCPRPPASAWRSAPRPRASTGSGSATARRPRRGGSPSSAGGWASCATRTSRPSRCSAATTSGWRASSTGRSARWRRRDEATARLRETLLAWLAEGANARRAAERLHAHKNTVLYRLQRAQRLLGRSLDEGRGDLELALRAREALGPRVAPPA